MAYSLETSSVKTIVPGAEVSGFCDVVARQKINEVSGEVPQLSAGEGIAISTVDGKTVITNNISAGSNISLVYDMETNTYRIDSQGGITGEYVPLVSSYKPNSTLSVSSKYDVSSNDYAISSYYNQKASIYSAKHDPYGIGITSDNGMGLTSYGSNKSTLSHIVQYTSAGDDVSYGFYGIGWSTELPSGGFSLASSHNTGGTFPDQNNIYMDSLSVRQGKFINSNLVWSSATWDQILNAATGSQGHTYTGVAPIQVNNSTDEISITGESLSAGPGIDMFSSGGYVVVSSTGKELSAGPGIDLFESGGYFVISGNGGNAFPITGTNGTTGFTANMDCSSMMLTTGASPAGGYVKQTTRGVQYEAYPATDVSASWYNIITATNNRSNYYCIKLNSTNTAASLENYSAYDRVTVIHSQDYGPDYLLHWDGKTKTFPSGLYCELAKIKDDANDDKWTFLNSGWINDVWWDYD